MLNVYDMIDFIRKTDSPGGRRTYTADFLNTQYTTGRLDSEDFWYMLRDLMYEILALSSYNSGTTS